MKIKVLVNGAFGKMGVLACKTIETHKDFELVAGIGRTDDLSLTITNLKPEIVIDLTRADCVYKNSLTIIQHGVHPVIGTTGLEITQIAELIKLCDAQQLGGLIVPNFSISAVLMMQFAAYAAKFLPEVEIIEAHHQQKLDAPSGTAMKTAEMIAAARKDKKNQLELKEIIHGARGANHHDINIHSIRLPGFIASQQVIFGGLGETLTITHNTIDRSAFMNGIILACQKVSLLKKLYYGLEHILNEEK